jgi:hypothetical protein
VRVITRVRGGGSGCARWRGDGEWEMRSSDEILCRVRSYSNSLDTLTPVSCCYWETATNAGGGGPLVCY